MNVCKCVGVGVCIYVCMYVCMYDCKYIDNIYVCVVRCVRMPLLPC